MAGLYLHIPFCSSRCVYCDFYSTTCASEASRYVEALIGEMRMRRDYLSDSLHTIYIGGGTPSLLDVSLLARLKSGWESCFSVQPDAEITLEANPDDLSPDYLAALRQLGFNRLSIGIQSFCDETLALLRRRHTAQQAIEAVEAARRAGFDNLSLDLIYGLPGEGLERWRQHVEQALALHPEHVSAYLLTYEEGTPLSRMRQAGKVAEADEELAWACYRFLTRRLREVGYEHYEISNFSLPGRCSRHNSSYWSGVPYLGCGPSAHSYNGTTRCWNEPDLQAYLVAVEGNRLPPCTQDERGRYTAFNDYVITRLRTRQGISLSELTRLFGAESTEYVQHAAAPWRERGCLSCAEGRLFLSEQGIFLSDAVMEDLIRLE